ncbi:MAG: ferritin-like domain-containing protein [Actinobacteria bacterium]|nr:ferritin-like domain-containing protein [Actinomycetota bacterium]
MSDTIRTWGELDTDGALQETVAAVAGDDRSEFLRKAAFGGAAVLGAGGLLGMLPATASAATPASDVAILNFALTLEYLEAEFYAGARKNAGIFKGDTRNFVDVVAKHEATHVAFLKKALGSAAIKKPTFDFKGTNNQNQKTFEATAQLLEDTGVSAYLGQAPLIKTKAILAAAGSILTIEARHAAWMRHIRQVAPAPLAFDKPKTKAQILAAVKGTGFITG